MKLISLTFDDALDQHLDQAIPVLDNAGLQATFYTHLSSPTLTSRMDDWKAATRTGHELGNHTVFHPGPGQRAWVTPGIALDNYDLDRMRVELSLANQWLRSIDGRDSRSFAFPGCHEIIGNYGWPNRLFHRVGVQNKKLNQLVEKTKLDFGNTRNNYSPILQDLFVAARTGGLDIVSAAPPIDELDMYHLPSVAISSHSWQEMTSFIERSLQRDAWAILQFHGVGGGHSLDCRVDDFRQLVRWIADHYPEQVVPITQGALKLAQQHV